MESPPANNDEPQNIEKLVATLFADSSSASGEEEMLRLASKFALQLGDTQIKALMLLQLFRDRYAGASPAQMVSNFIENYLEYKQYNESDRYVMTALKYTSLAMYIKENAFQVKIDK